MPAMRCPRASDWMPARTCSATRAEVNNPRHSTAETNCAFAGLVCTIQLFSGGMNSGTTKYHRNICTSSGMLRKNSTQALPKCTIHEVLVVRIVPMIEPSAIAMTQAHADTASVHSMPETMSCQYFSPPPGSSSKKTPQFKT